MPAPIQLSRPASRGRTEKFFASLDFPGRTTVLLSEMASKLGVSVRHLQNEVEQGALTVINVKAQSVSRSCWRVPIECHRDYVVTRLTGPSRAEFLAALPAEARMQLIAELNTSLKGDAP